jgi:RNA polymerase sigma factor (TIGR02999 family)
MSPPAAGVTQLLAAWRQGNQEAMERLVPLIYDELHRLAQSYLRREKPGHTLQTTALVNEAYLRLIDQQSVNWQSRAHFIGIAAQMMRRILVDHARGKQAVKRGGGEAKLSLDEELEVPGERARELVALDDALTALAALDPQQSRIIELRYFGGLSIAETAEVIGLSPATVKREWSLAKAWLYHQLQQR